MGRFIVWSEYKNVNSETSRWMLPLSMTTRLDFRNGDVMPNTWFPHWAQMAFNKLGVDDDNMRVTIRRWCDQNCQGDVVAWYWSDVPCLAFELNTDAMSFSLTWQDYILDQGSL